MLSIGGEAGGRLRGIGASPFQSGATSGHLVGRVLRSMKVASAILVSVLASLSWAQGAPDPLPGFPGGVKAAGPLELLEPLPVEPRLKGGPGDASSALMP